MAALEAMQGYGAVRLFVERARFGQPGFALSAQNARDVLTVCRRLDGIPLAIELAAARVAVLSPRQLAERLDDRFRLLTRGNRAAPARHQTLRTLVDWSYGLLTPEERSLFDRLAVFAGGFSLEAAEAVCAGEGLDQADVLPLLSLLVEKSLVNAGEEEDARVRFRLPETLREYARERLDGAGAPGAAAGATRGRHAGFYTDLAEEAQPALAGPAQGAWLDRLEREHDNLRAALRWHLDGGDARGALRLGAALGRFWAMRGYLSEGRVRLAEALATSRRQAARRGPAASGDGAPRAPAGLERARALYSAGFLAWRQGDAAAARPLLEASVSLARSLGDPRTTAIRPLLPGAGARVPGRLPGGAGVLRGEPDPLRGGGRPARAGPGPVRAGERGPPGRGPGLGTCPPGAQPRPLPRGRRPAQPGPARLAIWAG